MNRIQLRTRRRDIGYVRCTWCAGTLKRVKNKEAQYLVSVLGGPKAQILESVRTNSFDILCCAGGEAAERGLVEVATTISNVTQNPTM